MSTGSNANFWKAMLQGFLHDPGEKALILLRRAHERGTVKFIYEELKLGKDIPEYTKKADCIASSADRLSFEELRFSRVDFLKNPVIKHTITEKTFDLISLQDLGSEEKLNSIEKAIQALLVELKKDICGNQELTEDCYKKLFLAYWRFVPDFRAWKGFDSLPHEVKRELEDIGLLFGLLPADTRIPDHTIWNHNNLTAIFSSILGTGKEIGLLRFSIGPVQSFIAQARKASDLWAGSHLLAMAIFEAIKVFLERYGPASILFPNLHGLAIMDLWLMEKLGDVFSNEVAWKKYTSDDSPLWAAALPNVFTAIVPFDNARNVAEEAKEAVKKFLWNKATEAAKDVFGDSLPEDLENQIKSQLSSFIEVYYAAILWEIGKSYGRASKELGKAFAATKNLRHFNQLIQEGYKCSVCGEREWLTDNRGLLNSHSEGGIWKSVWEENPHIAKERERLCAVCLLKRRWLDIAKKEFENNSRLKLSWHNISTRAMAIARTIEKLTKEDQSRFASLINIQVKPVALPKKIVTKENGEFRRQVTAALDYYEDKGDTKKLRELERQIKMITGSLPERYYALVLMDGDGMGKLLSGEELRSVKESVHPGVIEQLGKPVDKRPLYPAYHTTISQILNSFSSVVVPRIVERMFKGKLIYAGGDDAMAFVSIDDVLDMIYALRVAFSGVKPPAWLMKEFKKVGIQNIGGGFIQIDNCCYMMLGENATSSMGIVIAHYSTPLSVVLNHVRQAENRAKRARLPNGKDRDGFSFAVLKRSGGAEFFTGKFLLESNNDEEYHSDIMDVLKEVVKLFSSGEISRRMPYNLSKVISSLGAMDTNSLPEALIHAISYQFKRQSKKEASYEGLAWRIVSALEKGAIERREANCLIQAVRSFFAVSEYLSREGRGG